MYSHGNEEALILDYFGTEKPGRFLDIGANDGRFESNTLRLAELGWEGVCVEPSPGPLVGVLKTHGDNPHVTIVGAAVAPDSKIVDWWDAQGKEVSTLRESHTAWTARYGYRFTHMFVKTITMPELVNRFGFEFDFVNIDVEGTNLQTLLNCPHQLLRFARLLCIENESPEDTKGHMIDILAPFGFRLWREDGCNLMFRKD